MKRPNLRVETNAHATEILFDGNRASAISFYQHGRLKSANAAAEVILAGGVVNTPQLLQLSGIGPAPVLSSAGIPVRLAVAAVGENLQDHYVAPVSYRVEAGHETANELARGIGAIRSFLQYLTVGKGLLAMPTVQALAFLRSRSGLDRPDIQIQATAASMDLSIGKLHDFPGVTIAPCQLHPQSRGWIRVASSEWTTAPVIKTNFLSEPADRVTMVAAIRRVRSIACRPALARYIKQEIAPGAAMRDDAEIIDWAAQAGFGIYHGVGTCAMGSDSRAVVDSRLRVRGLGSLRVVDASIMPRLISGNTNAAAIMIGEKGADLIKEDARR